MNKKKLCRNYCILPLFSILLLAATINTSSNSYHELKRSEEIMDTAFTITVYSDIPEKAEKAVAEAFDEIKRIESELNIYNNDSELSKLNKNRILASPSEDLKTNIERSLYYSNLSSGAFDITVQPILDLYKKSFGEKKSPPPDEMIKKELENVDYRKITIKNNKIKIGDNQRLTLGGIAKGYAVEKAIGILKKYNITMALVNAGGNMRALGRKPGGSWNIALRDPRDENNYITIIPLDNNAVSTSGDYERYFNENKTFHHIVNPKTGYSVTELISATIVTDNAFDADALSTTVFVLGKLEGMKLIQSLPNVEGLIITRNRDIIKSNGFKEIKTIRK